MNLYRVKVYWTRTKADCPDDSTQTNAWTEFYVVATGLEGALTITSSVMGTAVPPGVGYTPKSFDFDNDPTPFYTIEDFTS